MHRCGGITLVRIHTHYGREDKPKPLRPKGGGVMEETPLGSKIALESFTLTH